MRREERFETHGEIGGDITEGLPYKADVPHYLGELDTDERAQRLAAQQEFENEADSGNYDAAQAAAERARRIDSRQ